MKVKQWVLLGLASLALVGSVGIAAKNQAAESHFSATSSIPANPAKPGAIAQMMNSTKPTIVSTGSFASGEHPTQGTARIIAQNGKLFLELGQGFKTSSQGPDLVVILHRSSNVLGSTKPPAYPLKAGDYVFLAPLQKFSGAQRYAIPTTVNVAAYKSAAIWCRKFNATFGAAKLIGQ
jgi:Electron transfer DM13